MRAKLILASVLILWCAFASAVCTRPALAPMQGVASHFGFISKPNTGLEKIHEAGFTSLRDEVFWKQVEVNKGQLQIPAHVESYVNRAIAQGLTPVLVLGYGNPAYDGGEKPVTPAARQAWIRYASFVVQHFKGRVQYYELWNEWDNAIGETHEGKPEDYAQLVKEAAPALRKIDADACLIAGAVMPKSITNGFLFKAIEAGLLNEVDALSVHTYNYYQQRFSRHTPEAWMANMRDLNVQLQTQYLAKPMPLYITEMGWPSNSGANGTTQAYQAAYAQRMYLLAHTLPTLAGVWWYSWQDEGNNEAEAEHRFGVVDVNTQPKPIWHALKEQATLLAGMEWSGFSNWKEPQYQLRFITPANQPMAETLALWRTDRTTTLAILAPQNAADLMRVQFSKACEATKIGASWQVKYGNTPCLARIDGAWKNVQSH